MSNISKGMESSERCSWWRREFPGSNFIWVVGGLGLFSLCLVVSVYFSAFQFDELKEGHSEWAEFGTYLGGTLSGILAFLALLALLYTVVVQREELKSTKELIIKQNFETAFFNLIKLYQDTLLSIETDPAGIEALRYRLTGIPNRVIKGREVINFLSDNLRASLEAYGSVLEDTAASDSRARSESMKEDQRALVNGYFNTLFDDYEHLMGHYLRIVYHLFKFIDRSESDLDKQYYADLVRAQLSSDELYIIFYNCVSDRGRKSFSVLARRYNIFKHLEVEDLAVPSHSVFLLEMKP